MGSNITPVNATVNIDLTDPNVTRVQDVQGFWNQVINVVKYFVSGLTGILAVACVGAFLISCYKLAASSTNPAKRSENVKGILYSLIGIGLFGGSAIFTGLAFNLFR